MARSADYRGVRATMVERQIAQRGITDPRVLAAFAAVPREAFVSRELAACAYDDAPLPIGDGQTISQPYIVAFTADALQLSPTDRVLDIGTGSGYAAAVLSRLGREVFSVERVESLCHSASERLRGLGYDNVEVRCGDGTLGWPERAPFDAIAVAAVGPHPPPALLEQLVIGGRLVMPIGPDGSQTLMRLTRHGPDDYSEEALVDVRFVPLIGAQGFARRPRKHEH
ncbi:MAG TPA: protein-L-isoaspartate(D-aspartate) O-methyltransferase [Polyangiaceae bacterium]|nr:protein-L-isoaspartate(D-aspartate) O-methyltransferase [Polyangiaceae bacterium]